MNTETIVRPHRFTNRTAEGHYVVLAFIDQPGYITLADYRQAEAEGFITIHSTGTNALAESFGRTEIVYSVNGE